MVWVLFNLEEVVKAGSKDGRVYYQLAYSYQQLGDNEKASAYYKKAIDLFNKDHKRHRYDLYARYNLALLYSEEENKTAEAVTLLNESINKYQDKPELHNLLGWVYWKKGDIDKALAEYKLSVNIDPNQEDAQYNLAILLYNKRDLEQAKKTFEKVLKLNNNNQKAIARLEDIETKDFVTVETKGVLIIPSPSTRHCYLGKQYLDSKQYSEAASTYETALELDPNSVEAHYGLAVIYEYNKKGLRYGNTFNIQKSIFHYEKALQLDPDLQDAIFNLAVLYQKKGFTRLAINQYVELLRIDPDNAVVHYNLATLYDNNTKNTAKAIYHYNRYLRLDPDSANKSEVAERITVLKRKV